MDEGEHSNEDEDQTTEFAVGNFCYASFDDTPHEKPRLYALAYYNGKPITKGIYIWWYSSEVKICFCPEPNESVYSAVQIWIFMLVNVLSTHESYKDAVEIEDENNIISDYQIYRVQMKW